MDIVLLQKIGLLLAFALVLLFVNLKAGSGALKVATFWGLIVALVGAGYFTVLAVLA